MNQPSSPPNDHTDAGLGGPDDWIVRIARDGDGDSFIELFQSFAPRIKSYLIRSGLAEGVAEEIAQETLFTAWRKAGRFDPCRASAAAWLLRSPATCASICFVTTDTLAPPTKTPDRPPRRHRRIVSAPRKAGGDCTTRWPNSHPTKPWSYGSPSLKNGLTLK